MHIYPPYTIKREGNPFSYRVSSILLLAGFAFLSPACTHHRGPSDINEYIHHLEDSGRDEYQKPDEVIRALDLKPGMIIADIGAGSGYFTRRFSRAIGPTGTVIAVDVEPQMLDYNQQHISDLGSTSRTRFILATPDNPSLPAGQVDLIFFCNVYHHLDDTVPYIEKAKSALAPNGRIAVIDFYHDERSGKLGFSKHHLVPQERVMEDMQTAGFKLVKEHTFLPRQYFLEFAPR